MKFKNPLVVVKDMEKSKAFYREVLGLRVVSDFGANAVLTGGLAMQTEESWREFTGKDISYGGNDGEMYFEEDNFDAFAEKLEGISGIEYVHPVIEHRWGQRVVRFYDPDRHIIEVGENMKTVCRRFLDSGMTPEETAVRMDVPLKAVKAYMR
jgi:lactoylglutathione lyase